MMHCVSISMVHPIRAAFGELKMMIMRRSTLRRMRSQGGRHRRKSLSHCSPCLCFSGYSYANPSLGMRRKAAKQTMAVEPESLAGSLPGPERHVGQGADTSGEAAAAPRGPPARRGPWRGTGPRWRERRGNERRCEMQWRERERREEMVTEEVGEGEMQSNKWEWREGKQAKDV